LVDVQYGFWIARSDTGYTKLFCTAIRNKNSRDIPKSSKFEYVVGSIESVWRVCENIMLAGMANNTMRRPHTK
jgi:hypothetical protein